MAVLLRIAVVLHRNRGRARPPVHAEAHGRKLTITLPRTWLARHALSLAELQKEDRWIREMGAKARVLAV